jgi:photosystem II stability/assembly factor-like uncharacterized protein
MRRWSLWLVLSLPLCAGDSPQVAFSRLVAGINDGVVSSAGADAAGNIYLAGFTRSPGFPLVHPMQTQGIIFLTKFDTAGDIVYSTMLGTGNADSLGGMAVDPAGNAYLCGTTVSPVFPVVNALQPVLKGGGNAWIMKIDPTGQHMVYSTYFGGSTSADFGMGIAIDGRGSAYLTGFAQSSDFPVTDGAYLSSGPGPFIAKISPDGARLLYSTFLEQKDVHSPMQIGVTGIDEAVLLSGGVVTKLNAAGSKVVYRAKAPRNVTLNAMAVEPAGFVWAAGNSIGGSPVTADAAQSQPGGAAYYRSSDGGATWSEGADGLDAAAIAQIVVDSSGVLFAATERGLYRSDDSGLHWARVLSDPIRQVVPDTTAGTIYVSRGGDTTIAKTTDGGITWQSLSPSGDVAPPVLALDPQTPGRVYAGQDRVYRSDDGGVSWTAGPPLSGAGVTALAVDPNNASLVYAAVAAVPGAGGYAPSPQIGGGIYVSGDGGASFTVRSNANNILFIAPDPNAPGTIYATSTNILKSTDFGAHWASLALAHPVGTLFRGLTVDGASDLEVLGSDGNLYRSLDGGQTLIPDGGLIVYGAATFVRASGVLHLGGSVGANAYVMRIDNSGNPFYGTYWGGRMVDSAWAVAMDSDGNAYVVGNTSSPDFPQRGAVAAFAGQTDTYVLRFGPDGSLHYAVTWGGSDADYVSVAAGGPAGEVAFAGVTTSPDFPVVSAPALDGKRSAALFLTELH